MKIPGEIEWPVESIQYLVDPLPVRTSDEVMQAVKEQMERDLREMEAQAQRNRQVKNLS